jgi:hypothetical protein
MLLLGAVWGTLLDGLHTHSGTSSTLVLACAAAFSLLYAASGYLPVSNPAKLIVLLLGGGALWIATGRNPLTLVLGIASAVLGPATEFVLVHLGVFRHLQPDVLGIPIWLPALYLASAPWRGAALRVGRSSYSAGPSSSPSFLSR